MNLILFFMTTLVFCSSNHTADYRVLVSENKRHRFDDELRAKFLHYCKDLVITRVNKLRPTNEYYFLYAALRRRMETNNLDIDDCNELFGSTNCPLWTDDAARILDTRETDVSYTAWTNRIKSASVTKRSQTFQNGRIYTGNHRGSNWPGQLGATPDLIPRVVNHWYTHVDFMPINNYYRFQIYGESDCWNCCWIDIGTKKRRHWDFDDVHGLKDLVSQDITWSVTEAFNSNHKHWWDYIRVPVTTPVRSAASADVAAWYENAHYCAGGGSGNEL
jgi:hypothetical protein